MTDLDRAMGPGRATQSAVYRAGVSGREPRIPVRWPDLVAKAERAMSPEAWAYVHGSAGMETTAEANADAFDAWLARPGSIVGGCCGTTPAHIAALAARVAA